MSGCGGICLPAAFRLSMLFLNFLNHLSPGRPSLVGRWTPLLFRISLAFLLMSVFFIIFVADKSFFANTQPASRFSSSAVRYLPLFANLPLVDVDLAKQICIIHRFMNHTDCKHVIHWDEVAQVI